MEMLEGTMIANQWVFGGTQFSNNSIWSTAGASLRASLTRLNKTKAYAALTFLLRGYIHYKIDLAGFQVGGKNAWAQNQLIQGDSTRKHGDIIRKHGWDLTLGHLSSLKTQWVDNDSCEQWSRKKVASKNTEKKEATSEKKKCRTFSCTGISKVTLTKYSKIASIHGDFFMGTKSLKWPPDSPKTPSTSLKVVEFSSSGRFYCG